MAANIDVTVAMVSHNLPLRNTDNWLANDTFCVAGTIIAISVVITPNTATERASKSNVLLFCIEHPYEKIANEIKGKRNMEPDLSGVDIILNF
ncbi:hypothetical protein [Pantoea sp. App145]|uniref:hypothetical protein n=1 Tax=Pantoea sp. App145 TaxID=3071567 RepID=UPI003A800995